MDITLSKKIIITAGLLVVVFSLSILVAKAHDDTEEHNAKHLQEANAESGSSITPVKNASSSTPRDGRGEMERVLEERRNNLEERQEDRASSTGQRQENRAEVIEERQEARASSTEARTTLRVDRQVELDKLRQQRVLNLSANISNRMEAAIERLFNIISRLEERIIKLKKNGIDTEAAESKLREAAQFLSTARASLVNIDKQVSDATTSTEPISRWEKVRATYQETGKLIRSCHQALRETLSLLKTALVESRVRADSSATTTEENSLRTNE